jgi:hypothetical protein
LSLSILTWAGDATTWRGVRYEARVHHCAAFGDVACSGTSSDQPTATTAWCRRPRHPEPALRRRPDILRHHRRHGFGRQLVVGSEQLVEWLRVRRQRDGLASSGLNMRRWFPHGTGWVLLTALSAAHDALPPTSPSCRSCCSVRRLLANKVFILGDHTRRDVVFAERSQVRGSLVLIVLGLFIAIAADQIQYRGAYSKQIWLAAEEARQQFNHQVQLVLRNIR